MLHSAGKIERVPGSATSKAIHYSLKRWPALKRYLEDGAVPIDNNWVENQVRPWALGRKNWLFAGSLRSGQRGAAIMSLIQSAKLNGHDPYAYLTDVLQRLPTQRALLPLPDLGDDLVRNGAQCGCRDLDTVQVLDLSGDISVAHAQAVHRQDFGLDLVVDGSLVFLDQLRLKITSSIAGRFRLEGASSAFDRLLCLAVLTVGDNILGQMGIQLCLQGRLGEFLDQRGQDAVLPGDRFA